MPTIPDLACPRPPGADARPLELAVLSGSVLALADQREGASKTTVAFAWKEGDAHPLKAVGIVATIIVFGSAMLVKEGWALLSVLERN
jgi:hypothetical protein